MSKQTLTVPRVQAEMIGHCVQSLQAAREYARGLATDNDAHPAIRTHFGSRAAELSTVLSRIEGNIPRTFFAAYSEQVKDRDALRRDDILNHYLRMTEEQREALAMAAAGILKKNLKLEKISTNNQNY